MANRLRTKFNIFRTRLKFDPTINETFGWGLLFLGMVALPISRVRAAGSFMRAHRNCRWKFIRRFIEWLLVRFNLLTPAIIDRVIDYKYVEFPLASSRCFKLKDKLGDEKGVIIMKYNDSFTELCRTVDMNRFLNDYTLCLELSYYGCCNPQILQFLRYTDHHIVVGAVQQLERAFLERLKGNLVRADYSSSTWVNDKLFEPMNLPKIFDCIIIAMWDDIKRHHLLFEAIAALNDPSYRACLVGFTLHQDRRHIDDMIDYFGIRQNVIIFERIKQPQVNVLLNKSRVNVLLSFKEGGNKSIIEGFFADVPGIVLDEHIGIDLDWINSHTGQLVNRRDLSDTLQRFRTEYVQYHPRAWALQHISCAASTTKLESTLREIARREKRPWTRSLAVKVNTPECSYYDPDKQLTPLDLTPYLKGAAAGRIPVV